MTVDAYEPLTADYYVLVSRIGRADFRLIGYALRDFVANAPTLRHEGRPYHIVGQEYLFPPISAIAPAKQFVECVCCGRVGLTEPIHATGCPQNE